jgi:hypothetical protein
MRRNIVQSTAGAVCFCGEGHGRWVRKLHADMENRDLRNPAEFVSSVDVLTATLTLRLASCSVKHERECGAEHHCRRLLLWDLGVGGEVAR